MTAGLIFAAGLTAGAVLGAFVMALAAARAMRDVRRRAYVDGALSTLTMREAARLIAARQN